MTSFIHRTKHSIYERISLLEWNAIRNQTFQRVDLQRERLLVLPADPITLVGSKGEEAMLLAVRDYARSLGYTTIGIQTATPEASAAALKLGYEPTQTWTRGWGLRNTLNHLLSSRPGALVVLGADMLDGHYSPAHAIRVLGAAHAASRLGIKTAITGFSFNDSPAPVLLEIFKGLSPEIDLCLRDDVSLERFERLTGRQGVSVADVAFLLEKEHSEAAIIEKKKIVKEREKGKTVIAINAHPMLLGRPQQSELEQLMDSIAGALHDALSADHHSIFMFPHDTRGSVGDTDFLSRLGDRLRRENPGMHIGYVDASLRASEVKAVASYFDGVVTGRMHLGIASLGVGVPILALEYQGKFAGLLNKFHGSEMQSLGREKFLHAPALASALSVFLDGLQEKRAVLAKFLPAVKKAAERSLVPIQRANIGAR